MRIGAVSKQFNLSVDSLYYYIQYGLLVPPRPKGQYNFDNQTLADLRLIQELKSMDFTLKEIHEVLTLYRISGLNSPQDIIDLKKIYEKKIEGCLNEQKHQEALIDQLKIKIQTLEQPLESHSITHGLPLSMLDLLCCPNCGGYFEISEANMNLTSIFNGTLSCSCGYHGIIKNGILMTPNKNTSEYDKPDIHRILYKDLPPGLISQFQRSYHFMIRKIKEMDLKGKVILETYVNAWFFLHNHLESLDPQGKYIIVDKYPETLEMYKKLIEGQNYPLDILYIADSSLNLPLKKQSIDLNIDFFAINEHQFYHHSFFLEKIHPYLSPSAQCLGTYFYFNQGKASMKRLLKEYPESDPNNFNLNYFTNHLKTFPFSLEDKETSEPIIDSGNNLGFSFHEKGDSMHMLNYLLKK